MDAPAQAQTTGPCSGSGPCPRQDQGPFVLMSTGCLFHLPLPQIAAIAQAAGFAGLDLVMGSPKIAPGHELDAAHSLCPVRVVHAPFRNWSAWGGHLNAWRAAADLAGGLAGGLAGSDHTPGVHVTLHPPAGTLRDAIQTRWFARAVDLPRLLDARPGVSFSLENLPWAVNLTGGLLGSGLFGKDNLAELLTECQDKGLGLTLDVCHLGVSGRDILADLGRIPAGLLAHVHFSDAAGYTEHLPPGQGRLPLGPFLARLGRRASDCADPGSTDSGGSSFQGTVSLELDPSQLPDIPAGGDHTPVVHALATLRQGMLNALAGAPPPAWSGDQREGCGTRAPVALAALG